MHIIKWSDLKAVPWKNAQGLTREIAREPRGDGFAWRLSVADVAGDGPFSRFDGMRRILTVVDGKGMELRSQNNNLQANLGMPVEFDGSLDIASRLKDGALRDLNLIFNPLLCSGQVRLLTADGNYKLRCLEGQVLALYCMSGTVELAHSSKIHQGDTAVFNSEICNARIDGTSQALLVTVNHLS